MKALYRNILIALLVVFALLAVFSFGGISVYAEEVTEEVTEQTEEQTEGENQENQSESLTENTEKQDTENGTEGTDETVENYTFLGRLWEYLSTNYAEVISTAGTVIAAVLAVIVPIFNKKTKASVESTELNLISKNSEVISAVNLLIEGYNTLTEKYTEVENTLTDKYTEVETALADYTAEEASKDTAVNTMVTQTKAILEILTTVYANSKNVPQGVKDIVNLKYASALKADSETTEETITETEEASEG